MVVVISTAPRFKTWEPSYSATDDGDDRQAEKEGEGGRRTFKTPLFKSTEH